MIDGPLPIVQGDSYLTSRSKSSQTVAMVYPWSNPAWLMSTYLAFLVQRAIGHCRPRRAAQQFAEALEHRQDR